MKQARILYFVNGPAPTPEDFAAADAIAGNVVFRNAQAVTDDPQSLEMCDGVAGRVPALYAAAFPDADTAVDKVAVELADLSTKVGDGPAPTAAQTKAALKRAETAKRNPITPEVPVAGAAPTWNPNLQG